MTGLWTCLKRHWSTNSSSRAASANWVELARTEKDHATEIMLQWFVTEQVEEEEGVTEIIDQLKLAGDGGGRYMIDKELAQRVFTPPATNN